MILPSYSGTTPECPKCGHVGPSIARYCCPDTNQLHLPKGFECAETGPRQEHLHRLCGKCLYEWREKTKDANQGVDETVVKRLLDF